MASPNKQAEKSLVSSSRSVTTALDMLAKGLLERTAIVEEQATVRDIFSRLRPYEDEEPVDIFTFLEHDRYLGLKGLYPWIKWVLGCFYYPQDNYDEVKFRWNGRNLVYPGFSSLGFTREDVAMMHFTELIMIIGQRTGKSYAAAAIILYELYKLLCLPDPTEPFVGIASGSPIWFSVGATAQRQSEGTVWSYVTKWFNESPFFRAYSEHAKELVMPDGTPVFTDTTLQLHFWHKNLHIDCVHSRSGGLRGFTRKVVGMDEICHHQEGDKKSAEAMYDAMSASTKTFKDDAVKVSFSSPNHVADMGMRLMAMAGVKFAWSQYEEMGFDYITEYEGREVGDPNPRILGFHYPTWELNPELGFEDFDFDLRSNPESTWRDFGALPSQAEDAYFTNPSAIRECFDRSIPCPIDESGKLSDHFQPDPAVQSYHMHVDVGGGKPSNFGIAIGHAVPFVVANKDIGTGYTKSHRIVIDLAYAVRPMSNGEMNFRLARELLDTLIDRFHITCYSSDGWNDLEYQQRIRHKVNKVETFTVDKEHYEELKYAIYDGRFRCHHYPLAEEELKRLGLKNGTKVIKGTGYTKDVADCLAAVTYRCRDKVIKRHAVGFATMGVLAR